MSEIEGEARAGTGKQTVGSTPTTRGQEGASSKTATALRRACDCCRKRKVKCDGHEPCGPCKKASIRCAYLQPPKKKGPKSLRSARVLQALRRIDSDVNEGLVYSSSPDRTNSIHASKWSGQRPLPAAVNGRRMYSPAQRFGTITSFTSASSQRDARELGLPLQSCSELPVHGTLALQSQCSKDIELASPSNDEQVFQSPSDSDRLASRLPGDTFVPYIRLFYDHMFPIMPIIDQQIYLNPEMYQDSALWSSELYSFLCAICAATVVQLDDSIAQPPRICPTLDNEDLFANECLQERLHFDYIDSATTFGVMTSFFLFAYYGNQEHATKAWHYLQESITFLENLNMDVESSYIKLDPTEAGWRRRLYWLLFITERAYAVQRRKQTRLHSGVRLSEVFESEGSELLYGFVSLAKLFSRIGDDFVHAWRGLNRSTICDEAWLAETQRGLDADVLALENVPETQQLDITITREWLHVLAWQMGVSNGLLWGHGHAGMRLSYPVELARKVVQITSTAQPLALDSHGIGMEQKLSDIGGCLADVLRCTAGNDSSIFFEGKQYLNTLLHRLSSMRGKESRYLKPLLSRLDGVIGYQLHSRPSSLSLDDRLVVCSAAADWASPDHMLRVDLHGTSMPSLCAPAELSQLMGCRNGRFYDEVEANPMVDEHI